MARVVLLAAALLAALVGGCGGGAGDRASGPPAAAPAPSSAPATVELTDGRLGGATEARPGSPLHELSRGGRPDTRERDRGGPPRDGVGAGASCPNPSLAPAAASMAAVSAATLCLVNGERADRGLAPLALDGRLGAAASAYARDLVAGSYFSHTGRDGSDVLDRVKGAGYLQGASGWRIGENLAWGTGALATPGAIMQAWMNSAGHRDNILNPAYREIGVGIALGNPARSDGAGATYATAFGALEVRAAPAAAPTRPVVKKAKPTSKKSRAAKRRGKRRKARSKARAARRGVTAKAKRRGTTSRAVTAQIAR